MALVALTPWPYGAADPRVVRALALVTLAAALGVAVARTRQAQAGAPPAPLWPLLGLALLALGQLVPLTRTVLAVAAPGPAAFWHPDVPAAAAVLGAGPHPVSLDAEATRRVFAFTACVVALALAAVPALRARKAALAAAVVVCAGALAVAVYGVVARTLFGPLLYGVIAVPTVAPFGPFVSKNHFAGYVEMAALLAAGLTLGLADEARRSHAALSWVGSPRAGRVVLAGGVTVALALAVLISLSRGGAVSLAAGAFVLVVLRRLVRRKASSAKRGLAVALVVGTVAVASVAVLPPDARARLGTLVGMARDNSGQFRLGVWGDTLRLVARSPLLGHGFGAYPDALAPLKTGLGYVTVEHAESDVLEVLAEGGAAGLVLAGAALVVFGRAAWRGLRAERDRLRRGLALGALSGLAALLVHGAFDFNLRIPSNALLFAFLAALALASSRPAPTPATARARAALAAVTLALALTLAALTPAAPRSPLPAEVAAFAAKGGRPVTPLRVAQATRALERRLRARPAQAEAWLFLAWLRSAAGARDEAAALARYAATLDPQRAPLVEAAAGLADPTR